MKTLYVFNPETRRLLATFTAETESNCEFFAAGLYHSGCGFTYEPVFSATGVIPSDTAFRFGG
jgi:hypothetical protein